MKKWIPLLFLLFVIQNVKAQGDDRPLPQTPWQRFEPAHSQGERKPPFTPWEFMKKEDEFVTRHAKLTLIEANKVCPLIHKMKDEMRTIDRRIQNLKRQAYNPKLNDSDSKAAIKKIHALEKEKLDIEQTYQQKMLKQISPTKLLRVMAAEQKFDRMIMRQMFMDRHGGPKGQKRPEQNGDKTKQP